MEYLIGLAKGKGINVYIPSTSALLQAPGLYGVNYNPNLPIDLPEQIIANRLQELERIVYTRKEKYVEALGAFNELEAAAQWIRTERENQNRPAFRRHPNAYGGIKE